MKKILIAFMLIFSAVSFAQEQNPKKTSFFGQGPIKLISTKKKTTDQKIMQEQTPGYFLDKASKELITAGCTGIAAGVLCGTSAFFDKKKDQYIMLGIGGVCGIVSIVYGFKGAISIGKAGKALNDNRGVAYLKPSSEGLGLNLTF